MNTVTRKISIAFLITNFKLLHGFFEFFFTQKINKCYSDHVQLCSYEI